MTLIPPPEETHLESKNPLRDILKQISSFFYGIVGQVPEHAIKGLTDFLARLVRGAPLSRFSRVTPQLYVSGQHRKHGMKTLAKWGITGTVNMRSEYDDAAAGIAASRHVNLSTEDNTAPTMDELRRGITFIEQEIEAGGKVYIHCAAGLGRAPTMAAAYLVSTGLSPQQAWDKIRAVRPFIRPTPEQIELVDRLANEQNALT
ncbi:MAG: dual specificity protein phosphatase [Anaerolineae bacterium]